jgi:hypothetical protein
MARSASEINAEAQHLHDEAEALVAAVRARLAVARHTIDTAEVAAQATIVAVGNAMTATAANHIREADTQCVVARSQLAAARSAATQAFAGVAGADPKDEWKECRASIDRFDRLLVDLRKTGFGFLTTVVGGAAILLGTAAAPTPGEFKFVAFVVLGLLTITLFAVDCSHQIWLKAAVARATVLETALSYEITREITKKFHGVEAVIIGVILYLIVFAATSVLFWVSLEGVSPFQLWTLVGGLAGSAVIILGAAFAYLR